MVVLVSIGVIWLLACVVFLSLCMAASRGDEILASRPVAVSVPEPEVGFVANLAEPAPAVDAAPVTPSVPLRTPTRSS